MAVFVVVIVADFRFDNERDYDCETDLYNDALKHCHWPVRSHSGDSPALGHPGLREQGRGNRQL